MRRVKAAYVLALICWSGCQILYPTWQGRSYMEDFQTPGVFRETGSFGLAEYDVSRWQHPLWNPPRAYSDGIRASVRWPGQATNQQYHVELDLAHMLQMISLGMIALGIVLWLAHQLTGRHQPDLLVSIAWALAVALLLAWLILIGLAHFTWGYGSTPPVILTLLLAGLAGGISYGVVAYRRQGTKIDGNAKPSALGIELFWFILGALLACLATGIVAGIASHYRGDIAGVTELGTTRFAQDQTTVNLVAGCTIVAIGWLMGFIMRRVKFSLSLIAGWVIGMTILGGVFAMWK